MRVLNRLGCKADLADDVIKYFPRFDMLLSPFFGTGAIEFQFIGKIKYLIANDLNAEVFNLYMQIQNNFDALFDAVCMIPVHSGILTHAPRDKAEQAAIFLIRSNCTFMSGGGTLKYGRSNSKKIAKERLKNLYLGIVDNQKTSV